MDTQIICPSCKNPIPLTEALSHQLQEQLKKEREQAMAQIEEEKKKLHIIMQQWQQKEKERLEKRFLADQQENEQKMKQKITKELELQIKQRSEESEELQKHNKQLQEQLIELSKNLRQLKIQDEQRELEMEKKLAAEQEKIRLDANKQLEESYQLKMAEKDKKLQDALKAAEELRRKVEQGSQQTQGEVLEDQVGEILRKDFPLDLIQDVPKGKLGADLIQTVMTKTGQQCGTIIWELKRTKTWMGDWIPKLKDDQRKINAVHAVIISEVLPPDIKVFGYKDKVWIGNYQGLRGLAYALRESILAVAAKQSESIAKKEKMEVMWEYLTSIEFKQKVETIIEVFAAMEQDIEKEQVWFARKWEKQRKNIRRVIDNTAGMYGSLESIMGKALPEVSGLTLEDNELEETESAPEAVVTEKGTLF